MFLCVFVISHIYRSKQLIPVPPFALSLPHTSFCCATTNPKNKKLLELSLPILFVFFLVLIKISVEDTDGFSPELIPAYYPTNDDVVSTFSFTDYVKAMEAKRVCQYDDNAPYNFPFRDFSTESKYVISGIFGQGYHWQVPFVKCDSRRCDEEYEQDATPLCEYHALGVAPSSEGDNVGLQQATAFRKYIYDRYPQLLRTKVTHPNDNDTMPFDFEFVQMFDSDKDVEKYVSSNTYEPKLAMAIVFDGTEYPTINYNYKIRVNSTNYNSLEDEGRPAVPTSPPTNQKLQSYAVKDDNTCPLFGGTAYLGTRQNSCTGQYIYNGALILQRLVGDFIMEETGAKNSGYYVSEHGVQYAPFPTKEYEENGFFAAIACTYTKFHFFLWSSYETFVVALVLLLVLWKYVVLTLFLLVLLFLNSAFLLQLLHRS